MKLFLPLKQLAFTLGFLFAAFVVFYSNYEQKEIQAAVEDHAQVLSAALWNFNITIQKEYLSFVAEHNNYKSISVLDPDGEVFMTARSPSPNRYERVLLSLKLIPSVYLSAPIKHNNIIIGKIDVIWYRTSIYTYIYISCILLLILNVLYFYNRLMNNNLLLEDRVKGRTAELQNSEQKFKLLFETAGDGIFLVKDNVIVDCNTKALELFNYAREQIIGQPLYKISPEEQPDGRSSRDKGLEKITLALSGHAQHFVWLHNTFDGTLFYAEVTLNVFAVEGEKYLQAIVRDISQRIRSEVSLKESEEKYSTLIEKGNDLIIILQDNIIKFANSKLMTDAGYKYEEIIGTHFERFVAPSSRELVKERFENRMAGAKVPSIYEIEVVAADGRVIPMEINVSRIDYEDNPAVMVIMRDISERKLAEQELRKKEEQNALILRSLPMAFYVAQAFDNYACTWVSEQITSLTGFLPEQFVADANMWTDRIHPDDKDSTIEALERIVESGVVSVEYRWQTADGDFRWFHDEGVLIHDGQGVPKEIIGSWLDITERRNEQETLLITQNIVEHNSLAIFWMKPYGEVEYPNDAACKLLGFSREEMLNQHAGFIHPEGTTEYWDKYIPLLKEKKSLEFEVDLRKKDGSIFPAIVTATYLEFRNREYVVISIIDLSDRRRMERELRQAQKMEAIGTLAGGIAHDFNNILSAIYGFIELARMDMHEPDKLKYDLEEVTNGATRAKELVKQILAFSRRTEIEKSPLQISLIIKEAVKLLRSSFPSSIEIIQNIQSNEAILADPTQMHQIIMNLCTNAYHSMKEKGGTLTVSLTDVEVDEMMAAQYQEAKIGSYLKLTVSDTGHGISEDIMNYIFEPYYTTKEVGEGTGLGLAVVHGIVMQSGGFVKVNSESGKGTSVYIFLPLLEQKFADADNVKDEQAGLQGGTETIMFVDDEERVLYLATRILGKYGYQVALFTNGYDAWQEYQNHPDVYDLVVTDVTMPRMNGVELAENILGITPDKPIILCTGYSEMVNQEKALSMGVAAYMQKPLAINDLARNIKKILSRKSLEN